MASESEVTKAVVRFLQERAWIAKRRNVGLFYTADRRAIRIGVPGEPDWYFVHRQHGYLEVEMKKPGAKPDQRQAEYQATRKALGVQVTWCDDPEKFARWYEAHYGQAAG